MKYVCLLLFTFYSVSVFSQTKSIITSPKLTEGSAESVGMSEERLSLLDAMCQEAVDESQIPGVVALVARNGKIVYYKAFGMADNKEERVLKRDDIFRIASQTKAVTSTAVMILWEEGKFQLDDPISKYIPEFKDAQVLDTLYKNGTYGTTPADKPITIRHLITHTSGIGYGFIDGDKRIKKIYKDAGIIDAFTIENISIEENIKKLAKLPLHHNPGEKFTYSEGLDVLGYFIEIVSGMPLDEFFRTRIFDPLGMEDTWFYLPTSKSDRLVSVQKKEHGEWIDYPITNYDPDFPIKGAKKFFSGGGGLSSTAKDYATFLQMHLNNGELNGVRILSRTTVQFIMGNQIGDLWGNSESFYGLAFAVLDKKGQGKGGRGSTGTFEWGGYFNTQYFADPKENIIGILMKQTQDTKDDNTAWKFRILVGQSIDD
jgi:CubicO group peptidase (beta-lactamase class C family)